MKQILSFFFLFALMLAGCSPARPSNAEENPKNLAGVQAEPTATPVPTERPALETETEALWAADPEVKIIAATNCCGFTPELYQTNALPDAQVWGDGRIVWVQNNPDGSRQVLEGQLEAEQLSGLLQKATEAGFFGWEELYTEAIAPSDLPTQCLSIQLSSQSNKACEYYRGAPPAFHELYDTLAQGAGATGTGFTPERGWLVSYPVPAGQQPEGESPPAWDPAALDLSLAEATAGTWVEGPALSEAFRQVNRSVWGPFVQENGQVYQLSLQIPGVSLTEPPQ